MDILVTVPTPSDFDANVRQVAPDVTIVHARLDDEGYSAALQSADILLGSPPVDDVSRASRLRWLQLPSAGADNYVGRIPEEIFLTTASGVYGVPVSEHAFALMLAVARSIPKYVRDQTSGTWEPSGTFMELFGSTCGILGLGDIGLGVAGRAKAFGMRVVAVRRTSDNRPDEVDELFGPDDLQSMLSTCDFVVNTLPETPATQSLLDRRMLRAVKKGAVLVNVGRGSTVDEAALVEAIQDGHLVGAGLDVFEDEPLPEKSPLWRMANVVITPHVGGASPCGDQRIADLFVDNLRRFLDGGALCNRVDHELGY